MAVAPADVDLANAVIAGKSPLLADDVVVLGRRLAKAGERELARTLNHRRREMDAKSLAVILAAAPAATDAKTRIALAKRLANDTLMGSARTLLNETGLDIKATERTEFFQKQTLYTYKDPDLPLDWRLDRAFGILERFEDLKTSTNPESLALAGAIWKRKWEVDSDRQHLERSLFFYLRAYGLGAPGQPANVAQYLAVNPGCVLDAKLDQGYAGINAAFILDILGHLESAEAELAGITSEAARARRATAVLIREEILRSVPPLLNDPKFGWLTEKWWFYATVGEAHFGLQQFAEAQDWLVTRPAAAGLERRLGGAFAGELDIPDWEFESTARQLARLSRMQTDATLDANQFELSAPGRALTAILGNDREAVRSAFRGKVGIALSGGGFRAALFHIGVLASLAERDVLRHVEVLSCVSGGSIIGAHYYLELRKLLESNADSTTTMTAAQYVELVERIATQFLDGVQRNIRTRVLAEFTTNLKLMFKPGYSRTLRVGELYERELFSRVPDGHRNGASWLPDWLAEILGHRRYRWFNDLRIYPLNSGGAKHADFQPRLHNWRRQHKVPVLILNATSLNTGHAWQFTASFMGEPPAPIRAEIDANERLRRMYYGQAPVGYTRMRLGHAVAASSCVPGLFEPLTLSRLYPDRTVRLVDGGVCDNQGISSLFEQDCTVALVSDASGQMESEPAPSDSPFSVPLRANCILQARVREAQYVDAATRKRSGLLRGLMFVHLRRGLCAEQIAWRDCPTSARTSTFELSGGVVPDATPFGISTAMQRRLSAIRTDLDSFNDVEAFALMTDGYRMTEAEFSGPAPPLPGFGKVANGTWAFLKLQPAMEPKSVTPDPKPAREHVERLLDVGASVAFKIWKLSTALTALTWVGLAIAAAGLAWAVYSYRTVTLAGSLDAAIPSVMQMTFGGLARLIAVAVGLAVVGRLLSRLVGPAHGRTLLKTLRWRDSIRSLIIGTAMAFGGFLVARIHLMAFDKWFLSRGRVRPKA